MARFQPAVSKQADPSEHALIVRLFGPPEIRRNGYSVPVDTRKALALLAYLVVTGGQSRGTIAGLLWPEHDDERARGALRRTLSTLRGALGEERILGDRRTIAVETSRAFIDIVHFDQLLASTERHGHASGDVCDLCLPALEEAAELYRGDFMSGFALRDSPAFDDWQLLEAEARRRELGAALERLIRGHASTQPNRALIHARRWVALDRLNEAAHRWVMHLLAASGDRSAAIRQYRDCVRILDDELGVSPLSDTTSLYEAIVEGRVPNVEPAVLRTAPPVAAPRRYPLVGRSEESAALTAAWARLETDGFVVAVEGEAGIGKSRLVDELIGDARRRGARIVSVRCYEAERPLAYTVVAEALRQALREGLVAAAASHHLTLIAHVVPELRTEIPHLPPPPDLSGPGAHRALVEALAEVLAASVSNSIGGILFFDDIHWADSSSAEVIGYLARRLRGRPMMLVMSWRAEEMGVRHPLRSAVSDAAPAGRGMLLTLGRLDRGQSDSLVAEALPDSRRELSARLFEETEGVPFFLVQYLERLAGHEAEWGVPAAVRELLEQRLASVDEVAAQVLATAGVVGRSFDLDILRAASGRSDEEIADALEQCLARGLLICLSDEGIYDFAHEQLRALAYEQTTPARRKLLHRRVAEAMVGHRQDPARIAHHYREAGDGQLAARFYRTAGDNARAVYANAEALEHYETALALGHPDVSSLHEVVADLLTLGGNYGAAVDRYEAAAAQAAEARLPKIEHKLGALHQRRGDHALAQTHLEVALGSAVDHESALRALITADLSLVAYRLGNTDQAMKLADDALHAATGSEDAAAMAQAHNVVGILARRGRSLDRAAEHLGRSLEFAEQSDNAYAQIAALNNLGLAYRDRGEPLEGIRCLERAVGLCDRVGDRHRLAALYNNLADLLRAAGRDEEAMDRLKTAVSLFAEVGEAPTREPEIWKLVEW